jgi:hypothetical protein
VPQLALDGVDEVLGIFLAGDWSDAPSDDARGTGWRPIGAGSLRGGALGHPPQHDRVPSRGALRLDASLDEAIADRLVGKTLIAQLPYLARDVN